MHDHEFATFLMHIGDGVEPTKRDDMVKIPPQIAISWEGEHSIQILIDHIFPQLELHGWDASYMTQRILTPRYGLCNGTRLLSRGLFMNMLDVEILTGNNAGKELFCQELK
ncbi:hypothetical protein QL285_007927 [Trifolium repens]|nr:hypothetical protein QL285_007927 [Trifolium repens]